MTTIYYLHRGDNIPCYIGKTSTTLKERLRHHPKAYLIEAIDTCKDEEYVYWETWYIALFKSWGFKLENKNKGGGGVVKHTDATKSKISKVIKNHPTRGGNISKANKGKQNPKHPEWCESLKKPILQYTKQGEFIKEWNGAVDVSMYYGNTKNTSPITNAIKQRRQKTAYGFIWKYKI